jgi:hypothetical protein
MSFVAEELDKQPYINLLSTLEKLMGKTKYETWLANIFPSINTIEAQKKRVIESEIFLRKDIEIKITHLMARESLLVYEKEKESLLELINQHQIEMQKYLTQYNQYEIDRIDGSKKLMELQQQVLAQLNLLLQKISQHTEQINQRIQILDNIILRIEKAINALDANINKDITHLINSYKKLIDKLPESDQKIQEIKQYLLSSIPDVSSAIKNNNLLHDFAELLKIQMEAIKHIDPRISIQRAASHIQNMEEILFDKINLKEKLVANRDLFIKEKDKLETKLEIAKDEINNIKIMIQEPIQNSSAVVEKLVTSAEQLNEIENLIKDEIPNEDFTEKLNLLEEFELELDDDMPLAKNLQDDVIDYNEERLMQPR